MTTIARVAVACAVALVAWALLGRAGYVPLWDGRIYADCVVAAASGPWSFDALRCANHPSYAYVGMLATVQRLAPGSFPLMLAVNAALLALAWAAFARLLRRVLPGAEARPDRAWLLAAFVLHPVVLSAVLQINLDFGVLVFLLAATAAAMERRPFVMAAFGTLACFSKESGVLLYGLLVAVYAGQFAADDAVPPRVGRAVVLAALVACAPVALAPLDRRMPVLGLAAGALALALLLVPLRARVAPFVRSPRWVGAVLVAAAPLALFALDMLRRRAAPDAGPVFWKGYGIRDILAELMWPQFSFLAQGFLADIFVLQFHWVLTLVVAAALLVHWRQGAERGRRALPDALVDRRAALAVGLLLAGSAYLVSRALVGAIPRYVLPAYPLLLAAFALALLRLGVGPRVRAGAYALVCGAFALSIFHTVDPVSRWLWGTFDVGETALLRLNSLPRSCCGHGRDQSIYNLQFTEFAVLEQRVADRLRRRGGGVQVRNEQAVGFSVGPLDSLGRRTLSPRPALTPRVVATADVLHLQGERLWFVAVPYVDNAADEQALRRVYGLGAPDTVRVGAFAAVVWPIAAGSAGPPSSPAAASPVREGAARDD